MRSDDALGAIGWRVQPALLGLDRLSKGDRVDKTVDSPPVHRIGLHTWPNLSSSSSHPQRHGRSRRFSAPTTSSSRPSVTSVICPEVPPRSPASLKREGWSRLGIDVDNDFKPLYVVPREKKDQVKKLKALLADATELYLATDEDREGERRSPGTSSRSSTLAFPFAVWSSTRSRPRRSSERSPSPATSICAWSTRRSLGVCSIASTATRCRRCCGRRSCPGCRRVRVQSVATRDGGRTRTRAHAPSVRRRLLGPHRGTFVRSRRSTVTRNQRRLPQALRCHPRRRSMGKRVATGKRLRRLDGRTDVRLMSCASLRTRPLRARWPRRSPTPGFVLGPLGRIQASVPPTTGRSVHDLHLCSRRPGRKLRHVVGDAPMRAAQSLYEKGYITYMRTDSTTLSRSGPRCRPLRDRA